MVGAHSRGTLQLANFLGDFSQSTHLQIRGMTLLNGWRKRDHVEINL